MSTAASLDQANYGLPDNWRAYQCQRCRDCGSCTKHPNDGNRRACTMHGGAEIRPSHRCDRWHPRGTLL